MPNSFGEVRTTASEAAVKFQLVQDVSRFIRSGLSHDSEEVIESFSSIINLLLATLGESLLHGVKERGDEKVIRTRVLGEYFKAYEANCRLYLKETPIPLALTSWGEESSIIAERYATQSALFQEGASEFVPDLMAPGAVTDVSCNVRGALEMAWSNLRRAQQRFVCWTTLGDMYHNTPAARSRGSNSSFDFDRVRKSLMARENVMSKRMMMFSLLHGGGAADLAADWIRKTALAEGMSVIEHLCVDAGIPSRWAIDDEAQFRQSIQKR